MSIALGFWILAVGYALVYTGVQWFTSGASSLADNIGLQSNLTPAPGQTSATQSNAAGQLASLQIQQSTGGPGGTGSPSSGDQIA